MTARVTPGDAESLNLKLGYPRCDFARNQTGMWGRP